MTVEQISVFVENRQGKLVEVLETLSANNIDLRALCIADTADFGILRLIVNKPEEAVRVLQQAECATSVTQVLAVSLDDTPGSLARVLRILADAAISVEYLYAFVAHGKDKAYVILRVEDNEKAAAVLTKKGISFADSKDIYTM
ncbi:MAG TPA: ACT domain-containing protein [Papillibacter sp.]|jgi:hypothetical protein|nr:ACT domain-containing protein [Papillibacter sp.]